MKKFRVPHIIIMAFILFIVPYAYAQEITYLKIGGEVILLPDDASACDRENVSPKLLFLSDCFYGGPDTNNTVAVNGLNFSNTTIEGSIFPSAAPEGAIYLDIFYKDIEGIVPVGFTGIGYTHGSIKFKGIPFYFAGRYNGSYVYKQDTADNALPYIYSLSFAYNTCTASSPDSSQDNYVNGVVHIAYGQNTSCPAQKVLGTDSSNLENLRAFRDGKLAQSAIGRKAIQIYYNNADSINAVLERSPALRLVARRVLEVLAPMVSKN
jgi:hypothetical protein